MGSECLVILCVSWLTSYLCLSELTALLGKVFSNRLSEHRVLSEKTYIPPRHLHCDEWIKVRILDSMEMIRRKGQGQTGLSVPMACRARPPQEAPYLRPSQPRPSSRLAGCGLRSKSVMWLQRFLSNFFFQSLCASRTGSCFHFICLSHDTFRSGLRQNSYGSADREQTPALNQRRTLSLGTSGQLQALRRGAAECWPTESCCLGNVSVARRLSPASGSG